MSWILDFLSGLAAQYAQKASAWWRRSVVATVLLASSGLAVLIGLGFIAVGGYISLSEALAPWKAGVIVGAVVLLLSLIGFLIAWLMLQHKEPAATTRPPSDEAEVDTIAHLGETLGASLFKNGIRTTDIMIAALVAGTVLGASPALRDRLLRRKRTSTDTPSSRSHQRKR